MKFNIEGQIRQGYINIGRNMPNPADLQNDEVFVPGDVKNLDSITGDNTADEIIYNPPLNILTPDDVVNVIKKLKSKLKPTGFMSLWIVDIRKVGLGIHDSSLSLPDAHNLILGRNYENKTLLDTPTLMSVFKEFNLKVISVNSASYFTTLEVQNNEIVENTV